MEETFTIIKAKYQGYCFKCYYTIWKNENIKYSGKARHLNCVTALKDPTPRKLNPSYEKRVGKINKTKMIKLLKSKNRK